MKPWTRASVLLWARRHLPAKFRSCHIGAAAERDPMLGHFAHGQGILAALKRFDLVSNIGLAPEVPHARERCRGKVYASVYQLIDGVQPVVDEDAVMEARVLMRLDAPAEDARYSRLREAFGAD